MHRLSSRLLGNILLVTGLLAGCGPAASVSHPAGEAADTRPIAIEFQALANVATGELTFSGTGSLSQGLTEVPVVSDGVPGTGPADTVELVSTFVGFDNGDCGVADSVCWNVDVTSFYGENLLNVFAEIEGMSPATGYLGLNSAAPVMGLSDAFGLWGYGTVTPNTPTGELWVFEHGPGTFKLHGRVMADVPDGPAPGCSVLVISDTEVVSNDALQAGLEGQGLTVTMVDGLPNYDGSIDASDFGAVLLAVGNDYLVSMPEAGELAIDAAADQGTGFVSTAWFSYMVGEGLFPILGSRSLYQFTNGNDGTNLEFTLTSPGHPIWNGLPDTIQFAGFTGWNIASTPINGGVEIASSPQADIAVAVRQDLGPAGRVVALAHASNYMSTDFWTADTDGVVLTANALKWACAQ